MPDPAFLVSALLIVVTPGPDAALMVRVVLASRRRAAAWSTAAGMLTAGAVHAGISVAGAGLLLTAHPALLTALRWAGAAVLAWLGATTLHAIATRPGDRAPADGPAADGDGPERVRHGWTAGLLSTGANPKVALFLLAFLPQFVPPGAPAVPAMAVLAAVYLGLGALWLGTLAELLRLLRRHVVSGAVRRVLEGATGLVLVALAARMAVSG